jgi:hypothetical protein
LARLDLVERRKSKRTALARYNVAMLIDLNSPEFIQALQRAGDELGLADYYRPCVRPLFTMPTSQWPLCCGGSCEPCSQLLVVVADRVCNLLGVDRDHLP